ncbi:hypothetical protein ACFYRC_11225 [Streptomyces sp. NPDC005279]|uniref:hypothetical protein n=1 Tax=Streptomyces sp. NPDC005279 TaxID=3364712 RepID=UPI0036A16AA2
MAAIVGAAVGAVGGLGGGLLSVASQSRHHREQRRAERERWRDEMRRDAYNAYLAATRHLNAAWWKVADELAAEGSAPPEWRPAFVETHDAWARFSTASSAVAVAGPRSAAAAGADLHRAMRAWHMIGVQWARAAIRDGLAHLDDYEARFKAAADAKQGPVTAFHETARIALDTED